MAPIEPENANHRSLEPAVHQGAAAIALGYLNTTIFSVGIALMLWIFDITDLPSGLVVSLAIGWSVNTAFQFGRLRLVPLIGMPLTAFLLTAVGLIAGLLISSQLLYDDALLILLEAPGTVLLGAVFGITGYLIFGTRARLLATQLELERLERSQAEQQRQIAEADLKVLQAQIEPHFLFNTLSNIQSLLHDEPDKADRMLEQLTLLLRGSLSRTREQTTTLGQELDLVQAYLEIQRIRMGDRLSFELNVEPSLRSQALPPLLLQPLVENAITHGIEARPGPGRIIIAAQRNDETLELVITDDGPGPTATPSSGQNHDQTRGNGTALANIRERLATLYGNRAGLALRSIAPTGTEASLVLPLANAASSAATDGA